MISEACRSAVKVGICFSKELKGKMPLAHIVSKRPVYLRLLELIAKAGWEPYILTRLTYKGQGIFEGGWKYVNGKFILTHDTLNLDLVYDRSGGINFPPDRDRLTVINKRNFKILCWDKMATFKEISNFMPKTFLVKNQKQLEEAIKKIQTDLVVLKPFNGLKGIGVFIGDKEKAKKFKFPKQFPIYIAQEFVDTEGGIPGVTPDKHDLRVVVVNKKVVWCHVRVPAPGTYLANAAQGGNLTEVDYKKVPQKIKKMVKEISEKFYGKYDNPIFSLDFGMGKDGKPYIFEINDQIGFPKWEMKNRDIFLKALVSNFKSRVTEGI